MNLSIYFPQRFQGENESGYYNYEECNVPRLGPLLKQLCTFLVPPVVVNKSSVVYAPKGSYPYLYSGVRFDRKINVTYRWYFKGYLVKGGRKEVGYDGRLVIKGVSEQDQGVYRCDIRSAVGNYSTTVELIVQGKRLILNLPSFG